MRRPIIIAAIGLGLGGAALWFFARPRPTAEEQVTAVILDVARAVEVKFSNQVLRHISDSYSDAYGNNKRALAQQLYAGLRTWEWYTVRPDITSVQVTGDQAAADVDVRMWFGDPTQTPVSEFRVNLRLAREGRHWRINWAQGWAQAEDDYMNRGEP